MPETKSDIKQLKGVDKAAILLMCLGNERGTSLMGKLDESEIFFATRALAGLGTVHANVVEDVITEFIEGMSSGSGMVGNYSAAEKLLSGLYDGDKVKEMMADVRGPLEGKNTWEQFSAMNEDTVANYLRSENPQTVAAILTVVKPEMTAKVLPLLGTDLMEDVVKRMIKIESVPRPVLTTIENTLQKEFITSAARRTGTDPTQRMADVFNKLDPEIFESLGEHLNSKMPEDLERIKQKMFTFEDLRRLDGQSLARVMRAVSDGNTLAVALKGTKPELRDYFLSTMPERSKKMLMEEIKALGSVRKREAQDAQGEMVDAAMELAAEGAIVLPAADEDDELLP